MDKVHDIANRYFHDRFAQVKNPGPSGSCLCRVCTAEVGTNGAQELEILKWPFGVSQMFEDIMQFLGGQFIRNKIKDMSEDPVVSVRCQASSRGIQAANLRFFEVPW